MVTAIVLDIDGIIIGEKKGYNSPNPHPDIIIALKNIRMEGIPIILCSAKPYFAILQIIQKANLNNPHVTDGGAILIDPIDNKIIQKSIIPKNLAQEIVATCLENEIYVECYTEQEYMVQKNQQSQITQTHDFILQAKPKIVESLLLQCEQEEIIKIMPIAQNNEDKQRVSALLDRFSKKLSIYWGSHPIALPLQFGVLTPLNSSKKEGIDKIISTLGISYKDTLAIGDSLGDWKFMENCGYVATLENGDEKLKILVKNRKGFIGKSVDENGVLEVFRHYKLYHL